MHYIYAHNFENINKLALRQLPQNKLNTQSNRTKTTGKLVSLPFTWYRWHPRTPLGILATAVLVHPPKSAKFVIFNGSQRHKKFTIPV